MLLSLATGSGKTIIAANLLWRLHEAERLPKADAIDAAVFDLKAVNPNAIVKIDTRAPDEVIQSISDQGTILASALEKLRGLLK